MRSRRKEDRGKTGERETGMERECGEKRDRHQRDRKKREMKVLPCRKKKKETWKNTKGAPMADSYQCMEKPLQYCKVVSLQLKKK